MVKRKPPIFAHTRLYQEKKIYLSQIDGHLCLGNNMDNPNVNKIIIGISSRIYPATERVPWKYIDPREMMKVEIQSK
jgi:hypothetical protein